jgi:hypothetical protein
VEAAEAAAEAVEAAEAAAETAAAAAWAAAAEAEAAAAVELAAAEAEETVGIRPSAVLVDFARPDSQKGSETFLALAAGAYARPLFHSTLAVLVKSPRVPLSH